MAEEFVSAFLTTAAGKAIAKEINDRVTAVSDEATARATADTTLQTNLTAEENARIAADTTLQTDINTRVKSELVSTGGDKSYVFNEVDGGGAKIELADDRWNFIGVNNGVEGIEGMMYSLVKNESGARQGVRLTMFNDKVTYVPNGVINDSKAADRELAVKADVTAADAKINFSELISRVFTYGDKWGTEVHKLELMVKPGVYFVSTNAAVVGGTGDNLPEGETEGLLIVTKNGQLLICGITARQYYRHQDLAAENVTAYTSDNTEAGTPIAWIQNAMLSDVTAEANLRAALDAAVTATAAATGSAITVTGDGATKTIGLTLADNTLSQTASGLKAELKLKKQPSAEEGYAATYFLTDSTGETVLGDKINLIKDSVLKSATIYTATTDDPPADWSGDNYVKGHKYIRFVWETKTDTGAGTESIFYLDVESLIDSYTGVDCIIVDQTNNQIKLQIAAASEQVTVGSGVTAAVLSQDGNGLAVSNIQNAIDYAVTTEKTRAEGAEATLQTNIDTEASARATADTTLQTNINTETTAREAHAALDSRHTAEVEFVKSDKTETNMGYKQYVCSAALTGTLPADAVAGTKRIVSVVAGGEGTTIRPATGQKINGSVDNVIQISASNDTVTFIYDAEDTNWVIL